MCVSQRTTDGRGEDKELPESNERACDNAAHFVSHYLDEVLQVTVSIMDVTSCWTVLCEACVTLQSEFL